MNNQKFVDNVKRHNKFVEFIEKYNLTFSGGAVVDMTLPQCINCVVGVFDTRELDLNEEISLNDFPEIEYYIRVGRNMRLEKHMKNIVD